MKLLSTSYWIFLFLTTLGLWADKPIIDWYAWRDAATAVESYERPDFIFMNSGKNSPYSGKYSDVLLLSDWTLFEVDQKRAEGYKKIIGLITEPTFSMNRLLDPEKNKPYSWIETNLYKFDLILTFNKYLLDKYPEKCKFIHPIGFGTLYHQGIHEKSKLCSHMASDQRLTDGHQLRWAIVDKYRHLFDSCKEGNSVWSEWKDPWLNDFYFSVIVENSRESYYFSEKILECFRAGTVPIYWGCPTIGEFFDEEGIIVFNSLEELEPILKSLSVDEYQKRLPSIRRNFELAEQYPQFRLGPCRHKPVVSVDPECTWEYSATRPDVMDSIWPYVKPYFESPSEAQELEK